MELKFWKSQKSLRERESADQLIHQEHFNMDGTITQSD